jgi:hypothetical protein
MQRRLFILSCLAVSLVRPGSARAAAMKPFDSAAFKAAQQAGESIVVQVHAPW